MPRPEPEAEPVAGGSVGETETENAFFGEKAPSTEAWEEQQAAELAARRQEETDKVEAARLRTEEINRPIEMPEDEEEGKQAM